MTLGHSARVLSDTILRTFWLSDLFCCTLVREERRLRVQVTAGGRPLFTELCGNAQAAAKRAKVLRGIFGGCELGTRLLLRPTTRA